ncbi:alpha/beta-Hydrolases superfamily protein [Zea mays]|uniref:Alpha/beta-Hydrolases superfamily protein n=1 Tax=Zea mays TaxID=4577 RepID=A0A1D6K2Z6_MAIZE|nr:alpha/beta-Hydrolases superfamily protein [Zea mays]
MAGQRWVGKVAAAAVVALLLLSTALPGGARREPDVNNNGRSFVFNYTLTKAVVEYAAALKYNKDTFFTDFAIVTYFTKQGFEMTCIIVDVQNCLQAFVGVDHNLNAIIVSIRGTQENSIQNWIKDLIWKQVKLNYPNMPNAKVCGINHLMQFYFSFQQ